MLKRQAISLVKILSLSAIISQSAIADDIMDNEQINGVIDMTDPVSGIFVSPSFTYNEVSLDSNYLNENVKKSLFGIGLSLGYEFDSNFLFEFNGVMASNFSMGGASDRYNWSHKALLLGYRFEWEKVSLIPLYGRASWTLSQQEGQLFNSGGEEYDEIEGTDTIYGLSFLGKVNKHTQALMSLKEIKVDFGEVYLLNMGISYYF